MAKRKFCAGINYYSAGATTTYLLSFIKMK